MTTFDELIKELRHENLIDEISLVSAPTKSLDSVQLASRGKASFLPLDNFQPYFNDSKAALSTSKLSEIQNYFPQIEEIKRNSILEQSYSPHYSVSSLHKTHNSIKHKTHRRSKKLSKSANYCKTCAVSVPFYRLHCRYCHGRVVGNLFYYTLLIFSAVIFTIFILFIVFSKTYK